MRKLLVTAVATIAVSLIAATATAADSGPRADVAAIHRLFAGKAGPCTQRVDKVSVRGSYALVTVVQGGACDMAVVGYCRNAALGERLAPSAASPTRAAFMPKACRWPIPSR